jgi:hypothetical protein
MSENGPVWENRPAPRFFSPKKLDFLKFPVSPVRAPHNWVYNILGAQAREAPKKATRQRTPPRRDRMERTSPLATAH